MINLVFSKQATADALKKCIKEATDYKYAPAESFIVAITDLNGIALMNKYLQKTYPCAKLAL